MGGPSIMLSSVGLKYAENTILENINCEFTAGKCHVIMGPNGGGKTSLLRSALGLTPFTGEIALHWPEAAKENKAGNIGYVPQKAVFESSLPLTVLDFVILNQTRIPLFWRRKTKQTEHALMQLERVGMAARSERRMGLLSGGEQQRVLFAQALLDDPDLLILDEPTTGMDEHGVRFLEGVIKEMVAQGKTILAVHHDVTAVRRLNAEVHVVNRHLVTSGHHSAVLSPDRIESLFKHYSAATETR